MWSKAILCRFRQPMEILQTQASQGFAAFRPDPSRIPPRHSQTTRATNCATPGYIYILVCFLLISFPLSVRGASLRNIVAALRLVRSLRSLFLHLGAMPLSAPGGGIPPRPTAPHPVIFIFCLLPAYYLSAVRPRRFHQKHSRIIQGSQKSLPFWGEDEGRNE